MRISTRRIGSNGSKRIMIRLTRINKVPLVLNSDLIEHLEVTPDTVVSLTNGQKFLILETPEEVIDKVVEFRRLITQPVGAR